MANENPSVRELNDQTIVDLFNASLVVQNAVEKNGVETVLMTSVELREKVAYAAVHLAKLLQSNKKSVLIMNLDYHTSEYIESFFSAPEEKKEFIEVLDSEDYLSEAIFKTQYSGLDFTVIEEYDDREFINLMLSSDLKERLVPIREYYDVILLVGPNHKTFLKYGNIFNLADAVIPVVDAKKNKGSELKQLVDEYRGFNLRNLGVLRGK
ncbi:MAG TPA: hypothetical protein K8V35_07170 [Aliicoccus persicus]|uniref:AAA domain-containing protein n=1 Tax=Aliicoccus persicus TaxID=930138 RepID=A0A921DXP8_9STAP|nr:hypothetical protein [Aliicoccus persicus]